MPNILLDTEYVDMLRQLIAELEDIIDRARNYSGIEAEPCPLCTYQDGVFLDYCEPHRENEQLKVKIIELQKELESVYAQDGVKYQTPFLRSYKE